MRRRSEIKVFMLQLRKDLQSTRREPMHCKNVKQNVALYRLPRMLAPGNPDERTVLA